MIFPGYYKRNTNLEAIHRQADEKSALGARLVNGRQRLAPGRLTHQRATDSVFNGIFQALVVHHRNFSVLHAIELVTVGQVRVACVGLVVAFVIGNCCGQVVFGRSRKVVRRHAVVVANAFKRVVFGGVVQGVKVGCVVLRVGGMVLAHGVLLKGWQRRHAAPPASLAGVKAW